MLITAPRPDGDSVKKTFTLVIEVTDVALPEEELGLEDSTPDPDTVEAPVVAEG